MGFMASIKKRGFTIVELLIVIVVIGILAAITIVAFNGVQGRAHDAAVSNDLKSAATLMEMYRTTEGAYPASAGGMDAINEGRKITITKSAYAMDQNNNVVVCVAADTFGFAARSKSGKAFMITNTTGLSDYTNSWQGSLANNCTNLVGTLPTSNYRNWGYTNSTWQSWLAQ